MIFNPTEVSKEILNNYLSYLKTTFFIKDKDYRNNFLNYLSGENNNYFFKGPYLQFSDSFKSGKSVNDFLNENILSKEFLNLKSDFINRNLYKHQEKAILKSCLEDKNLVITTGTGSGKTESFLIPVINHLMREFEWYIKKKIIYVKFKRT